MYYASYRYRDWEREHDEHDPEPVDGPQDLDEVVAYCNAHGVTAVLYDAAGFTCGWVWFNSHGEAQWSLK